ncbi:MAG: hypothetical protein KH295_00965 [Clostridiaceae bacterium]|nr:hypothetical protein [uncultured Agathobaculum sp.]MBS6639608.1 hypothetical protein [Clostridiaceae bacterium]HIX11932.1 hypothetical protein [Candidatus Agathobaculum pullistercoris]
MKKRILIATLLVVFMAAAGAAGFRFLAVHTVADYLPAEQPIAVQVLELENPGTQFEQRQTQDAEALYRTLCETKVRRRWALQNQFSGDARYAVYVDYNAAGSYHIVYYPAATALDIYCGTERIYAASVIEAQPLARLLPGFPGE